jgi:hypothetical protein
MVARSPRNQEAAHLGLHRTQKNRSRPHPKSTASRLGQGGTLGLKNPARGARHRGAGVAGPQSLTVFAGEAGQSRQEQMKIVSVASDKAWSYRSISKSAGESSHASSNSTHLIVCELHVCFIRSIKQSKPSGVAEIASERRTHVRNVRQRRQGRCCRRLQSS